MFRIGLNPYGIAFATGLFSTPDRRNPAPLGLSGFLDLADRSGAQGVELPCALLQDVPENQTDSIRARIHRPGHYAILMHGLPWGRLDHALSCAQRFGFTTIRMHLTSILCGGRSALGSKWKPFYESSLAEFEEFSHRAAALGIAITLENHQDLTSAELIEICARCPNTGICLDTGNPLAVGENPLEFARAVAPLVRHLHLKDYRVHWSADGYRLARCAIGCGAVDFPGLKKIFAPYGPLPASIEPGALTERHVRLLCGDWWEQYPARTARDLAAVVRSVRASCEAESADWRTPWDLGATPEELVAYELSELDRSFENMRGLEIHAD